MNLKKKVMVLFAAGIVALSASPLVLAATPEPAGNTEQAVTEQTTQQTSATVAPAAPISGVQTADASELTNKKYLTKGGAAFWFIFTIILNGALSFWIGNRFYRLARKDNHVSGEIRALRKDIEEKFVKSVGGFAEQEVDINNLNESLAMDDEGIKPMEKQPVLREVSAEEEERFRRWEEAQSKPKNERVRPKSAVKEELDEELDDVKKIRRKNYQPKRSLDDEVFEEEDNSEDLGETKEIKLRGEGVKSKAKEILGDIFPFKED
ncbi:MAG: hypothetical protein ACI4A5_02205 [Hominilimicola sp.]